MPKSAERQARLHPSKAEQRAIKERVRRRRLGLATASYADTLLSPEEHAECYPSGAHEYDVTFEPVSVQLTSFVVVDGKVISAPDGAVAYHKVADLWVHERDLAARAGATAIWLDDEAARPRPWRAPDKKAGGKGWHVLDADGQIAEYAKSRDKARARAKEVNG
jgi:hypothetical protein